MLKLYLYFRTDFKAAILSLCRNRDVWLVALSYALPGGVQSAWSAVTAVVLKDIGLDDSDAGMLSLAAVASLRRNHVNHG